MLKPKIRKVYYLGYHRWRVEITHILLGEFLEFAYAVRFVCLLHGGLPTGTFFDWLNETLNHLD